MNYSWLNNYILRMAVKGPPLILPVHLLTVWHWASASVSFFLKWPKTSTPLTVLHFTALCWYGNFSKLRICGNLVPSKSIDSIFPRAFAHFMFLLQFGNSCNISSFLVIIALLWWSVISDSNLLKAQMTAGIFSNNVFLIKTCAFFWDNAVAHLLHYGIW